MPEKKIPDIVVGRLPLYYRVLQRMFAKGQLVTSSKELAEILEISAAQIRKDLSQFGEFGKQGTGYHVEYLANQLHKILKLDRVWDIVIVGAGDVGNALAHYQGFHDRGFKVAMIFDNDPKIIGKKTGNFIVKDSAKMIDEIKKAKIKVAMIAVPASEAQKVTDDLVKAGVKAILNYAPIHVITPPEVRLQCIDPALFLQRMTYYL